MKALNDSNGAFLLLNFIVVLCALILKVLMVVEMFFYNIHSYGIYLSILMLIYVGLIIYVVFCITANNT